MVSVVGGTYREYCIEPAWNELFGSGFRAAVLLASSGIEVKFFTRLNAASERAVRTYGAPYGIKLHAHVDDAPTLTFRYLCPLDEPRIRPTSDAYPSQPTLHATGGIVLAYGMLDARTSFTADVAVWDPQSSFPPKPSTIGSAQRLAIVANRAQILALGGSADVRCALANVAASERAEVVVAKSGLDGALVWHEGDAKLIPAYLSAGAFTVGSGDVFSATFAREWAVRGLPPASAADTASRVVSAYADHRSLDGLDQDSVDIEARRPIRPRERKVYLAAPFFNLADLALLELAEHALKDVGLIVKSPLREIGIGEPDKIAPADLALLDGCDAVFAIITSRDIGTLFEIGYAKRSKLDVYAYAPRIARHQQTMLEGTGVRLFKEFAPAVVALATDEQ